jgi:bacterioferritin
MSKSNQKKYRSNKPYPTVTITEPNIDYAYILLDDYASADSELTAITQYVYAHVLAVSNPQLAEDFLQIGIVEMTHLDLLADTIIQLGVAAKYVDSSKVYWDASLVPYGISNEDRLKLAIQAEIGAINQYKKHIALIKNEQIDCLLERIIMDEEIHLMIFKADLEEYYC